MKKETVLKELKNTIRRINYKRKEKVKYDITVVMDGKTINIKSAN